MILTKPVFMKTQLQFFLSVCIFLNLITGAKAQSPYVTIPDANFRTFLETNYASCMSGGMLDTTCAAVVNAGSLTVSNLNIVDLTGIQYFKNLTFLYCDHNQLTSLPIISSKITQLSCNNNQLTSLPKLPASLILLYCQYNQLTNLPALPPDIDEVDCFNNQLTSLPDLPSKLSYLDCKNNQLHCIPTLPNSLQFIRVAGNSVVCIPNKPSGLSTDISQICNDGTGCGMVSGLFNNLNDGTLLNVYPNPSKGIFNVSLNSGNGEQINVQIFDQYGSLVLSSEEQGNTNDLFVDLNDKQKGVYMLVIIQNNKVASKKLYIN